MARPVETDGGPGTGRRLESRHGTENWRGPEAHRGPENACAHGERRGPENNPDLQPTADRWGPPTQGDPRVAPSIEVTCYLARGACFFGGGSTTGFVWSQIDFTGGCCRFMRLNSRGLRSHSILRLWKSLRDPSW